MNSQWLPAKSANKPRWAGGKQVRDILSEMKTSDCVLVLCKDGIFFEVGSL